MTACRVAGCLALAERDELCGPHYRHTRQKGLPRPRVELTVARPWVSAHPGPTDEALRRGRVRRAIEDREFELRLRRQLDDGDW